MKNKVFSELSDVFPSLIPLKDKVPIEKDWQYHCENNRLYDAKDFKGLNAGIPCGPANGIIVVDVDHEDKFELMRKKNAWELPETRMHLTGRELPHYFYQYPTNGKRYGNRSFNDPKKDVDPETGKVIKVFDIRGIGGQVVAPGSIHPDTGRPYEVINDVPIAPAPQWLLELALKDPEQRTQSDTSNDTADLESLPISYAIKNLIRNGTPRGQRSEAIASVLSGLIRARVSDNTIFKIFNAYPVGKKYHEKGQSKGKWLQDEINRAQGFNDKNGQKQQSGGVNLSELKQEFSQENYIKFIWKNTIPEKQPVMFAGREGSGKTTILLHGAKEILDAHPSGGVVWVSTEGTVVDTIHKALVLGLEDKRDRFQIARKRDKSFKFSLENRSDLKEFDNILTGLPGTLVVFIDSVRGMSRHSENDDKLGKVMQSVNAIVCDKHKAALVYLDHYKKGTTVDPLDKVAGSTAKTAAVRLVMGVEKKSVATVHVKSTKNNFMGVEIPELESIQIGDKIHIRELTQLTDQSLTNKCQLWLTELMSKKKQIPAKELYDLGEDKQFSSSLIKKVKRDLPITVDRIENRWWWVWAIEG